MTHPGIMRVNTTHHSMATLLTFWIWIGCTRTSVVLEHRSANGRYGGMNHALIERIANSSAKHTVFQLTGKERGASERGALQDGLHLHSDDNEWDSSLHLGQPCLS